MKTTMILLALLLTGPPAHAVSFDTEGFGQRLNGWRKDRTACYSLTDAGYRTHIPTITGTPGGGMFLSTEVDLVGCGSAGAVCHLGLTFSASGVLEAAQIKSLVEGKNLDTGLIRRQQVQSATPAAEGEEAPAVAPPPPGNPTDEMIAELFESFDTEFKKVTESKDKQKRDLFSRIGRTTPRAADIAAGLRHNINLILQHVNRHGSSKEIITPGYETPRGAATPDGGDKPLKGHPAR
jgi:hypothetical protein